jgi:hypothetical protein
MYKNTRMYICTVHMWKIASREERQSGSVSVCGKLLRAKKDKVA